MNFGQLTEYNKRNIFLPKSCRKLDKETSSRPLFVFKALYEVKESGLQLSFNILQIVLNLTYDKSKLPKTLHYWSRDFSEKGLGIVSPPHFVYDLSRKQFLILYSIHWLNLIVPLPLLLEILGNMCITNVYYKCVLRCYQVTNFEINLIFLIKLFLHMTKKSGQKLKYLENKKSFSGKIKSIFHHFFRAFSCQKLSQTWESAFKSH